MYRGHRITGLIVSLLLTSIRGTHADDWPQWRGPNRDGISRETGLLKDWPAEGPKLLWQIKDLGDGYGSPSVVGNRIYVISNKGNDDESVKGLNVKDGSPIWTTRIGNVGNPEQRPSYPGARSTPTASGDLVYALGSDGDLACLEANTGTMRWQKSLRKDFGGKPGTWAYSESPLVDGNMVLCTPGGAEATVVALDKGNGQVIWKSAVPGGDAAGYSSLIVADVGGIKQYIAYVADGVVGLDAKTGKFLWRYDKTKPPMGMSILTPIVHDNLIYTGAGRVGGGLVRLIADQGQIKAEQAYFDTKLPTAIGGAVLVEDHLYGSGGQMLVCADFKTGTIKWSDRSAAPGSLCYADGRLYLHGEGGDVVLLEATPEAYRPHGRFMPSNVPKRLNQMEKAWAYPVIANGCLYLRDTQCLWCYDIKTAMPTK
jgi:outer membrane protein assembly factor BamB